MPTFDTLISTTELADRLGAADLVVCDVRFDLAQPDWGDVLPLAAWLGIALIVAAGIIATQRQARTDRRAAPQSTDD